MCKTLIRVPHTFDGLRSGFIHGQKRFQGQTRVQPRQRGRRRGVRRTCTDTYKQSSRDTDGWVDGEIVRKKPGQKGAQTLTSRHRDGDKVGAPERE